FIEEIPGLNSFVVFEAVQNSFHVRFETGVTVRVFDDGQSRTLHPTGIMNMRFGIALFAERRVRIPHTVEKDKERADVVLVGNLQETVHPIEKAGGVLVPKEIVKENAHTVEAKLLGVAQFAIDRNGVKGVSLPHLELVDRGAGREVTPNEPGRL